jgi:hypothetical protein
MFELYQRQESIVDELLERTDMKRQILAHFPNPVILHAPSGAGAFSFAKTCVLAAGYSPTVMDALDEMALTYGNIRKSLYAQSKPTAYIFKEGHGNLSSLPEQVPILKITHHPISKSDCPSHVLQLSLSPLTELQFAKLFYLYTCDKSPSLSSLYHVTQGNFHILAHMVWLYRTHIRAFYGFLSDMSMPPIRSISVSSSSSSSSSPPPPGLPWNIPSGSIQDIRELYSCRRDMPSIEEMGKSWPQYISSAWRIVLPRYASFARCGIFSGMPRELVGWYMMDQFRRMPAKGKSECHPLRSIPSDLKLDSVYDLMLYSSYSYGMPRESIESLFRRIHNAYYGRIRSNKNKITTKTKKESIDQARLDIFPETSSWNEKIFRKWTQYTAGFSR